LVCKCKYFTRICLERIREAMLHHRWQEAAEYMVFYPQKLEGSEIEYRQNRELIWRISIELLHHMPNSKLEDYNNIHERMKHLGVKIYLKVSLEQSFHLMLCGQIEEAKQLLAIGESWRYGKESASQHQTAKLIQAYRSLLDYVIWCDKKFTLDDTDDDSVTYQDMHSYFRQASVHLKEIFKNPGVWDPFIVSYVEMLEFYDDHEEALKILNDYAYDDTFPPNPNAHVFLYQYLKRRGASDKKLTKVLKVKQQIQKKGDIKKALGIVMDMLDFACWRKELEVWRSLNDIIGKLNSGLNWKDILSETVEPRKDWWPALHFTSFHAAQDSKENPELMKLKAPVAKIFCPGK
uniref:TATA box binding protein (TBP)-associated factor, RNA polymerase I, A n=1 Tax=Sphaeramia orbicularis TaxID=375764 RepID=A0A673BA01_9TELE